MSKFTLNVELPHDKRCNNCDFLSFDKGNKCSITNSKLEYGQIIVMGKLSQYDEIPVPIIRPDDCPLKPVLIKPNNLCETCRWSEPMCNGCVHNPKATNRYEKAGNNGI